MPGGRVTGVDDAPSTEPPTGPGAPADRGDDVGERPAGAKTLNVHVTLVVVLALCAVAFRFELGRALGGNGLSWAYVFEWPIFAGYAVFMWWKLIHEPAPGDRSHSLDPSPDAGHRTEGTGKVPAPRPIPAFDRDRGEPGTGSEAAADEELASYNRYLAALHDSGKRKRW